MDRGGFRGIGGILREYRKSHPVETIEAMAQSANDTYKEEGLTYMVSYVVADIAIGKVIAGEYSKVKAADKADDVADVTKVSNKVDDVTTPGNVPKDTQDVSTVSGKSGKTSIHYTYDSKKIGKQMKKRGWTEEAIQETLNNPVRTVKTRDRRWLPGADGPLDDPATAYYASDGSYVVRNDKTGAIIQISNKNDSNWVAPWDVED